MDPSGTKRARDGDDSIPSRKRIRFTPHESPLERLIAYSHTPTFITENTSNGRYIWPYWAKLHTELGTQFEWFKHNNAWYRLIDIHLYNAWPVIRKGKLADVTFHHESVSWLICDFCDSYLDDDIPTQCKETWFSTKEEADTHWENNYTVWEDEKEYAYAKRRRGDYRIDCSLGVWSKYYCVYESGKRIIVNHLGDEDSWMMADVKKRRKQLTYNKSQ
jgi:hypothetical protein